MQDAFTMLVQRDHDDIASAFEIILAPRTSLSLLQDAVDGMRLAFTVHAVAEQRVMKSLVKNRPSFAITEIAMLSQLDHVDQERRVADLAALVPGSRTWNKLVLELRGKMLRHSLDMPGLILALADAAGPWPMRQLASRYATERMRVLAETLPARLESAS